MTALPFSNSAYQDISLLPWSTPKKNFQFYQRPQDSNSAVIETDCIFYMLELDHVHVPQV